MNTLKINRMNDFYFKYLLGSEQRKHLTIQFLNDVLYENEEKTSSFWTKTRTPILNMKN